jgi:hypothetical protein
MFLPNDMMTKPRPLRLFPPNLTLDYVDFTNALVNNYPSIQPFIHYIDNLVVSFYLYLKLLYKQGFL